MQRLQLGALESARANRPVSQYSSARLQLSCSLDRPTIRFNPALYTTVACLPACMPACMLPVPSSPLLRLRWSTLPVATRRPLSPSSCRSVARRLALSRPLSASSAASNGRPAAAATGAGAGVRYAAVLLSVLAAGGAWLGSSTVSADAPPRALNSGSSLARQVNRAAAVGDVAALRRLLKEHPAPDTANLPHPAGWTPLLAASANGHEEAVRLLLDHGADVNAADRYAVNRRNLSTDLLRSRGEFNAAINPRISCTGWTPLHYAVAFQHVPTVALLLSRGANLAAKTADGDDPLGCIDWEYVDGGAEARQRLDSLFAAERERRLAEQRSREKEERVRNPLEVKLRQSMLMPIYSVSSAIRRRENGWFDSNKPLVFLFLGSSGVGKTMLAKTLAKELHPSDQENGFIRIDMTEFASKHEMARLIGSPPGYVGHEAGGQLTTKLSTCPDAVVLLDEVEKAHPDVLTLMLQVFDEGRLTDGKGNTIQCPNAIFIMTSNLVQDEIREAIREGHYQLRPDMPSRSGSSSSDRHHAAQHTRLLADVRGVGGVPALHHSIGTGGNSSREQQQQLYQDDPHSGSEEGSKTATVSNAPSADSSSAAVASASPAEGAGGVMVSVPNTVETIVPVPSTGDVDPAAISLVAKSTDDFLRSQIHPILKRHFRREEFLGRINDIVVFHPLLDKDLRETVETELGRWKVKAYERHRIVLRWSERLVDALKSGYDERYGYRSMIYTVEKRVVNLLAAAHERDQIGRGSVVELDVAEQDGDDSSKQQRHHSVVIRTVAQLTEAQQAADSGDKKRWFGLF